jgi:hypothetical protein
MEETSEKRDTLHFTLVRGENWISRKEIEEDWKGFIKAVNIFPRVLWFCVLHTDENQRYIFFFFFFFNLIELYSLVSNLELTYETVNSYDNW